MSKRLAAITGVHGYVPDYVLTNAELEKMVDTTDEWITSRTGIKERRILKGEGMGTSEMAKHAALGVLEKTHTDPNDLDIIICATVTPDMIFPAMANILAHKIGATKAFGYDMNAACSGFLYAINTAARMIESGAYDRILVVGADKMSSIIDYEDRATCILFGDAAGAVMLEATDGDCGIRDSVLYSDGSGYEFLYQKAGGSMYPPTETTVKNKEHYVIQEGKTVFKFAVSKMADAAAEIMERNHLHSDDIAYLVPHQANKRIIDATRNRMGISEDKVMINIQKYGNTTNATIPLCLWEWESKLKKGDNLVLAAFGGGFTWGAVYVKWAYDPK